MAFLQRTKGVPAGQDPMADDLPLRKEQPAHHYLVTIVLETRTTTFNGVETKRVSQVTRLCHNRAEAEQLRIFMEMCGHEEILIDEVKGV